MENLLLVSWSADVARPDNHRLFQFRPRGHRKNLRHELGLRNRVDLTRYAIRAGLIAP